jgi:hypothetical protein
MVNPTISQKRFLSIKNIVINLESATIKWKCQMSNFLKGTQIGSKSGIKLCCFSLDSMILLRQQTFKGKTERGQN